MESYHNDSLEAPRPSSAQTLLPGEVGQQLSSRVSSAQVSFPGFKSQASFLLCLPLGPTKVDEI